jgi:serine/threonine-protein kinase
MDQLAGQTLGQYQLYEVLGRGSTATVYRAYQQSLGRYVAIKVLHAHLEPQFAARFRREAHAIAQLHHRNILPIYDYGEAGDLHYFVTQYIDGGFTLAHLAGAPLDPSHTLRITLGLLDALDYAHQRGIVHRDVKPSNVLMPRRDWPLLADFGIARLLDDTPRLTPPGQMIGTAAYMSPERAFDRPADARADLYALGVVLYELLVGRVPFDAPTAAGVLAQHIHMPPPPPRSLNPQLPPMLDGLLLRALEKDPTRRYQSAAEMAVAVRAALTRIERERDLAAIFASSNAYQTVELPALDDQEPPARPVQREMPALAPPPEERRAPAAPPLPCLLVLVAALIIIGALGAAGFSWVATAARPPRASGPIASVPTDPLAPPTAPHAPTAAPPTDPPAPTEPPSPTEPPAPTEPPSPTEPPAPTEQPVPTDEPLPSRTALPTPTSRPAPSATPQPTPREERLPAPPVASLAGSALLEDDAWEGGFGGFGSRRTYGGRSAVWIYGQGTGYETMRAAFVLPEGAAGTALLRVEGMDSEGRGKTEISIAVNGTEIYRGPNPLPDDDLPLESGTWATHTWEFDAALLRAGVNEVSITNESPGAFSRPPFFMLDYAEVVVP